jgi:hypothetical protein
MVKKITELRCCVYYASGLSFQKSHKGEKCTSSVTISLNFGCKMFKKMGMTFEFLLEK